MDVCSTNYYTHTTDYEIIKKLSLSPMIIKLMVKKQNVLTKYVKLILIIIIGCFNLYKYIVDTYVHI